LSRPSSTDQAEILGVPNQDPIGMFLYAIRAKETRRQYTSKLKAFFDHLGLEGTLDEQASQFVRECGKDGNWALNSVIRFINFQKERVTNSEITESTLRNYYKPIKLFCEMNDIQLAWKKIAKGIPRARSASNDRSPTIDEIRAVLNYPDRRIKPIILTMISSGIRLGAWDYLRWGEIEPIIRGEEVVAAKIKVYRGEPDEYMTFVTPEAYNALKEWIDYRAQSGEKITQNSWVMRDLWDAEHYHRAFLAHPVKLKSSGIKRLIERALWAQGIRKPLEKGNRRHEFKADHGFRKYFKTRAEQAMRPINVEILMGHSTGISDSYYRPKERELSEDYLKAIPELTILPENQQHLQIREQEQRISELERNQAKIKHLEYGIDILGALFAEQHVKNDIRKELEHPTHHHTEEQIQWLEKFSNKPPDAEVWTAYMNWGKRGSAVYSDRQAES